MRFNENETRVTIILQYIGNIYDTHLITDAYENTGIMESFFFSNSVSNSFYVSPYSNT